MKMVIVADTNFLVSLTDATEPHCATASAWFTEIDRQGRAIYLPVIALAEFAIRGDFDELMMVGDFLPVDFSQDDAVESGRLFLAWEKLKSGKEIAGSRNALKDDFKILATAKRLNATHILTADEKMARVAKALDICRVIPCHHPVDKSFFNKHGQREIPLEGLPDSPATAPQKKKSSR